MIIAVHVSPLAPELFPSSAAALIFSVVFFLWILSEIVGAWIVPTYVVAKPERGGKTGDQSC
ncbi:MAG: hypothetical protein ACXV2D_08885 [Halobacteriota archaeon]